MKKKYIYKKTSFVFIIIFCIFLLSTITAIAVENDLGLWAPVYIYTPITDKIHSYLEINPRIQEDVGHINQFILRPSIGYKLTNNLSIWQGYAWVNNYLPKYTRENRVWHQLLHEKRINKLTLLNRLRLEERFIQNVHGIPVRTRYMLRGKYPLGKTNFSLVASDELFLNISTHFHGPQRGIDQNRFFTGINYKFSEKVDIEGGYLMQYINSHSPMQDKLNHNIVISLFFNLPQLLH